MANPTAAARGISTDILRSRERRTTYVVREYEQIGVPATDILRNGSLDVFPSVIQHGYFTVRPRAGPLALQAGGFIGVIPLNERVAIDVRTRVPVRNLSRVLRVSGETPLGLEHGVRLYDPEPDLYPSLVDVFARTMCDHARVINLNGLLREYVRREESTSFPRGRILMNATMKSCAAKGLNHRVSSAWFQRTTDNPSNRCLKYSIWVLAQLRATLADAGDVAPGRRVVKELNAAFRSFDGVALDRGRRFLADATVVGKRAVPAVRAYYRPALDLALLTISRSAIRIDHDGGEVAIPSLVLNMGEMFESYLRNVLVHHSQSGRWGGTVLNGNISSPRGGGKLLFDSGKRISATPDIVVKPRATSSSKPVVIDVKYKPAHKLDRDDLNQIVAYGASYRCRDVVLVQPKSDKPYPAAGLRRLGVIEDLRVHQYIFDLDTVDLMAEEERFGSSISALCST